MKKLKEELINHYNKILFFSVIFLLFHNCKENRVDKYNEKQNSIISKDDFHKCTKTKDTIFSNGNYIKYIPINDTNYSIEIKLNKVIDTLDFCLNCKTQSGMLPKLILESDWMCFLQGSTSYRYLTLCKLDKENKNIDISKFETARSTSATIDGFVFIDENNLFFYDLEKAKLLSRKLSDKSLKIKYSELSGGNNILIEDEQGNTLTYNLKEFH